MASKAVEKLVHGDYLPDEWSYRDRIRSHYRSKGKVKLTDKDREIIERSEAVQEILMANRGEMTAAKQQIKDKYGLNHREEIERYIEDAVYLFGAMFTMDKNYQRMIQWQDIETGIKIAKESKEWKLYTDLLLRREKLFQLDTPDVQEEFEYFTQVNISIEFRPELFKNALPPDWEKQVHKIKMKAMKDCGLITEITDAEYTNG